MWLSYTLPCHKREADLRQSLPYAIRAANAAPDGVEILVVDYGDQSPLALVVREILAAQPLRKEQSLRVVVDRSRPHFHMSHARNVGIRQATGDYVMIASADFLPDAALFGWLASAVHGSPTFMWTNWKYRGAIVVQRAALLACGGFDERLEFYGPEDKELTARLTRCGVPLLTYPDDLLDVIRTPDDVKVQGYRLTLSKQEMSTAGRAILWENEQNGLLVANQGLSWGQ